jgi:hypothetical protein
MQCQIEYEAETVNMNRIEKEIIPKWEEMESEVGNYISLWKPEYIQKELEKREMYSYCKKWPSLLNLLEQLIEV